MVKIYHDMMQKTDAVRKHGSPGKAHLRRLALDNSYATRDFAVLRAHVQRIPPTVIACTYYDPNQDAHAATPGAIDRHPVPFSTAFIFSDTDRICPHKTFERATIIRIDDRRRPMHIHHNVIYWGQGMGSVPVQQRTWGANIGALVNLKADGSRPGRNTHAGVEALSL